MWNISQNDNIFNSGGIVVENPFKVVTRHAKNNLRKIKSMSQWNNFTQSVKFSNSILNWYFNSDLLYKAVQKNIVLTL